MNHEVQVFEIGRDAKPDERPRALAGFAVSAGSVEEARRAALARLAADGRAVRSLSFTDKGGLVAVVHAPEAKGGR